MVRGILVASPHGDRRLGTIKRLAEIAPADAKKK